MNLETGDCSEDIEAAKVKPVGVEKWLEEIEVRANGATPGPWETDQPTGHSGTIAVKQPSAFDWVCHAQISNQANWRKDCVFIAHSREDIPRLLRVVKRLREDIAKIETRCRRDSHEKGGVIRATLSGIHGISRRALSHDGLEK